jgi:diguanylate cyclase (GGDEF)-like protein/PAS domain S-box-containing protein
MADGGFDGALADAIDRGRFGVVLLSEDGRVLRANGAACELLSAEEPELIGRPLADLVHPDDRGWTKAELDLVPAGAIKRFRHEVRLLDSPSGEVWSELNVRPVSDCGEVRAVAMLEDARDRPVHEAELRKLADTDPLTELLNRRRFGSELDQHLERCRRYGTRGALLMIDIDRLKQINGRGGHLAGDRAIVGTATLLRSQLRSSDLIARVGGDEFAVLLPDAIGEQATAVAKAILSAARAAAQHDAEPFALSIGAAAIVDPEISASSLIAMADAALYEVKRAGGDGLANVADDSRPEAAEFGSDGLTWHTGHSSKAAPEHRSAAVDGGPVELQVLLLTIADLGSASLSLAAWELCTDEPAVRAAWADAAHHGWLKRARYDAEEREWLYELTSSGAAKLESLEQAKTPWTGAEGSSDDDAQRSEETA